MDSEKSTLIAVVTLFIAVAIVLCVVTVSMRMRSEYRAEYDKTFISVCGLAANSETLACILEAAERGRDN